VIKKINDDNNLNLDGVTCNRIADECAKQFIN
jgi:hypothetical protein